MPVLFILIPLLAFLFTIVVYGLMYLALGVIELLKWVLESIYNIAKYISQPTQYVFEHIDITIPELTIIGITALILPVFLVIYNHLKKSLSYNRKLDNFVYKITLSDIKSISLNGVFGFFIIYGYLYLSYCIESVYSNPEYWLPWIYSDLYIFLSLIILVPLIYIFDNILEITPYRKLKNAVEKNDEEEARRIEEEKKRENARRLEEERIMEKARRIEEDNRRKEEENRKNEEENRRKEEARKIEAEKHKNFDKIIQIIWKEEIYKKAFDKGRDDGVALGEELGKKCGDEEGYSKGYNE